MTKNSKPLTETEVRIMVCKGFIDILQKPDMIKDPRQPAALEEYQKQLKHLEERLEAEKRGLPLPIVIGLKPATLSAVPLGPQNVVDKGE